MPGTVIAALPAQLRPLLESKLPGWIEPRWWATPQQANDLGPGAEIGWLDMRDKAAMDAAIGAARDLKWLNSFYTGVDALPLELLAQRKVTLTNGSGLNALTIAEYVLMGMLTIAKGYRDIVRAQDRHEWLREAPGKVELSGSKALLLGYGGIGSLIEERLKAFNVEVTVVRRSPQAAGSAAAGSATAGGIAAGGVAADAGKLLGPDQWRARLGEFDWVILAVPATAQTQRMIGASELAAMKKTAVLLNIARGAVVDQDALTDALTRRAIGAAFLDVTEPEPLPADHPLWKLDNAHITMHLSGLSQTLMMPRAAERFIRNLQRYRAGEPLHYIVDLAQGY